MEVIEDFWWILKWKVSIKSWKEKKALNSSLTYVYITLKKIDLNLVLRLAADTLNGSDVICINAVIQWIQGDFRLVVDC